MEKDFDAWNLKKKLTERSEDPVLFYEREVWWCIMGTNIGVEIDGKHELFLRPVIVARKFNKHMLMIIPSTTQDKIHKYYLKVSGEDKKAYTACQSILHALRHPVNNDTPPGGGVSRRPKPIIKISIATQLMQVNSKKRPEGRFFA